MSTAKATRPDLTGLPYEDRVCIAVAEAQGATWRCGTYGSRPDAWRLWRTSPSGAPEPLTLLYLIRGDDRGPVHMPRYTTDPAAWGPLMERERIGLDPRPDGQWAAYFVTPGYRGWLAKEPGMAVCLAVFTKYGITVDPAGIAPSPALEEER